MIRHSALALVLLAFGTTQAAEKKLDRTFTVSPGGTLTVNADAATVRVAGVDAHQVTVHMLAEGSEREIGELKFEAVQRGSEVIVTSRRNATSGWLFGGSRHGEERIEVTVPRRYVVNVRTGGGGIELSDTTGAATLKTSGGDIAARNLDGTVQLRTSGGGILAENVRGDVDADTSGGDVRLMRIDGKIKANTSGGSVRCSLVGANREISAITSGGDIELVLPRGTRGEVEAMTSGGSITSDLPISAAVRKETRLEGSLNGGGPAILARTSGGSIRLRQEN